MSSAEYDACVSSIDEAMGKWYEAALAGYEATNVIEDAISGYLLEVADPRDDVRLLCAYALERAGEIASSLRGDRLAVEHLRRRIAHSIDAPALIVELDMRLAVLRGRLDSGDTSARADLADLCAHGRRADAATMICADATEMVLRCAFDTRDARALSAAVHPKLSDRGQLGARPHALARRLAFDLLAALAADLDHGRPAIDELLDLVGYVDTAREAAVRLPVHLLTRPDCDRLLTSVDHHEQRLTIDGAALPWNDDELRIPIVLRSVAWQALETG